MTMAYTPHTWIDAGLPGATPITAGWLNEMEQGIADANDPVDPARIAWDYQGLEWEVIDGGGVIPVASIDAAETTTADVAAVVATLIDALCEMGILKRLVP